MQLAEVIENTEDSSYFSRIHMIFLGLRDFLNLGLIQASSSNNRDDSVYCMVNLFPPRLGFSSSSILYLAQGCVRQIPSGLVVTELLSHNIILLYVMSMQNTKEINGFHTSSLKEL